MTSTIDIKSVQEKILVRLEPSGWRRVLEKFIVSPAFEEILLELYSINEQGFRFTPPLRSLFRAFETCPYDRLKVVFVGKEPYDGYTEEGVPLADGLAFSRGNNRKVSSEQAVFFEAIQKLSKDGQQTGDPDLLRWSEQGVLLIHSAMTVMSGYPGSHITLWKRFVTYVIEEVNRDKEELFFVFIGKHANEFVLHVDLSRHYAYNPPYPMVTTPWVGSYVFQQINKILTIRNLPEITW